MPNWCSNKLTITGPQADVQVFKTKAVGHSPWEEPEGEPDALNFHSLVPVPDEVVKAGYGDAGFDWERANWGCKWGAANSVIVEEWEGHAEYSFDTAWSPPIEFFENLAKQWPSLTFVLQYEELGMAFKGIAKFHGDTKEDHCISL
jgi:hypothetical protein